MNYEEITQKIELLQRVANAISDEVAKADFRDSERWLKFLKDFRRTLYEEIDYLENVVRPAI